MYTSKFRYKNILNEKLLKTILKIRKRLCLKSLLWERHDSTVHMNEYTWITRTKNHPICSRIKSLFSHSDIATYHMGDTGNVLILGKPLLSSLRNKAITTCSVGLPVRSRIFIKHPAHFLEQSKCSINLCEDRDLFLFEGYADLKNMQVFKIGKCGNEKYLWYMYLD